MPRDVEDLHDGVDGGRPRYGAGEGEQAEDVAHHVDEYEPHPEGGEGVAEQRDGDGGHVEEASPLVGGVDAEQRPEEGGEKEGRPHQEQGVGEPLHDLPRDRLQRVVGVPEVPGEGRPHVADVLHVEGFTEAPELD